jgi:hypothetical protein
MPQFLIQDSIGEADITFQIKLSEQIDRLRRILNSGCLETDLLSLAAADIYIPGACKRLAERCEAMLSIIHFH